MKLLLDTCTFLWWIADHPRLGIAARQAILEPHNECWLSAMSLWEALAKHKAGRLGIDSGDESAFSFLCAQCAASRIALLPIVAADIRHVCRLPDVHRDPFDRLLICQAIEHGLTLVTPDRHIRRYPIRTLW